jgi:hypothetical protein
MASPELKIEEQLADSRSDQIAYKLTVSNPDSQPVRLLSIQPRVPIGASVLEITDSSLAQANAQKAKLLEELNRLLRQFLWVTSEAFRQEWTDRQKELFKEIFSVAGIITAYVQIFTGSYQTRMRREFDSFAFGISSAADARSAYEKWMATTNQHEAVKTLFEEKTKQLERVEGRMDESERPGLTSISPGGYFTATYVMKFSRKAFEPRKYQVGFEATYSQSDSPAQSNSVATTVQISPYPLRLSVVAVFSALLGIIVRLSVNDQSAPFNEMLRLAQTGQLLVGPIVALVFFNVYEYTTVGKEMAMSVSWRSALLIGALSGLAHDRILLALKALIGV